MKLLSNPYLDLIAAPTVPKAGLRSIIVAAGNSVQVSAANAIGGYIYNPITSYDQQLLQPDVLYVCPIGPAATSEIDTTVALQPGGRYEIPREAQYGIWVNSNSSGHNFVVVQVFDAEDPNPPYFKGDFPPTGPTGVLRPIPSYLYQEYSDDSDLQAFVAAYNSMMQDIIDTLLNLNLPIYTKDPISGALLDWVGQGLYGISRPSLTYSFPRIFGPYNTYEYNVQTYNQYVYQFPDDIALTDDDIYRRVITWHFHKGDGKYFSVEWLKKRVMRFLLGINGTCPNIDNTYQISVTFGASCDVTIRIVLIDRTIIDGAIYNNDSFQYNVMQYNQLNTTAINYPPLPTMTEFADAVRSGVLELPFMFNWDDVVIG
jgi:hypothetical protein